MKILLVIGILSILVLAAGCEPITIEEEKAKAKIECLIEDVGCYFYDFDNFNSENPNSIIGRIDKFNSLADAKAFTEMRQITSYCCWREDYPKQEADCDEATYNLWKMLNKTKQPEAESLSNIGFVIKNA